MFELYAARKKLISCKIVDQIVLSYPMRRKTERKYFCSVHAKSFKTLHILSFFSRYNAAHET